MLLLVLLLVHHGNMGKDQDLLEACRTGNLSTVEKHLQSRLSSVARSRTSARGSSATAGSAGGGGPLQSLSKSFWNLKSANINCVDASGDTPLHLAALNGHKEIVSILLECEASPTILDSQDCSPLHLAAWNGHTDICKQLIAASDDLAFVNLQTRDGNTALHFSAQHGHDRTLCLLLEKKADPTIRNLEDLSALDLAAQYDRLEIVKQLVTSHPELVAQRSPLNTPLHLASRNGHRLVVQYLIDAGFPIHARTDKGTALHEAANFCKLDVIRLLLDRGIDITVKSQTGCTAEDILRSIPSRAAEDALNILKTYIYHQRTPDSDGERGIVSEGDAQLPASELPQGTPPLNKAPPSFAAPSPVERKTYLHKSLPSGHDTVSTPPPIPPRQSVRLPDRSESFSDQGLVPLKVTMTQDRGNEREHSSDEDKHKLSTSPHDISPSPRDASPSARSPTDQPKKPPRKKPLSFRRMEQGPHLPTDISSGGGNYVNLDPNVERALVDARASIECGTAEQPSIVYSAVTATSVSDMTDRNTSGVNTADELQDSSIIVMEQPSHNNNENQKLSQEVSTTEEHDRTSGSLNILGPEDTICDGEEKRDESWTKPPSSLDIVQIDEKMDQVRSSCQHQPPTPDCPPPSPGTAIQNIHSKIQPTEKRRSRDIETITDSSLACQDESTSSSSLMLDDAVLTSDINYTSLTPVTEEVPLTVSGTSARPSRRKNKPTPLPRKSSLTSETKDLYPRSPANVTDVSASSRTITFSDNSELEEFGIDKPAPGCQVCVLSRQEQLNREFGDGVGGQPELCGMVITGQADGGSSCVIFGETVHMRRSVSAGSESLDWEGHAFAVIPTSDIPLPTTTPPTTTSLPVTPTSDIPLPDTNSSPTTSHHSTIHHFSTSYSHARVFTGLLRGSVAGPARDVLHQLEVNNVTAAALRKKRKSTLSTFAPVMEEDKDIDPDKVMTEIDSFATDHLTGGKRSDDSVFDDDSEDWAQISATFETFGVGLSRESVFVREHEANFAKYLSQGKTGDNKIQSVGEWLSDIGLPQYENSLVANGFDDTDFLGGEILEDQDLLAIGVESPGHRQTILEGAATLARLKPIDPLNLPVSVAEWLGSIRLDYYYDTFTSHKYDTMDRVVKLWELELVTVLDITSIGHRKRILASLGERPPETANVTRNRVASLEGLSHPKSPFDHVDLYRDYTGVKSRITDTEGDSDIGQGSLIDLENSDPNVLGCAVRDNSLHIRAPHLIHYTGAIKQWRHKPEVLIKGCCNYTAHYLGSTLVKELKGAMSTQEGIAKLKKSSEVISKIPTIMLSISFKGVKFIDAVSKKVVCDHEIANIFCACQDGEHMNFFAYITKDREASKHYCHVFSVRSRELAGEIILTLGEAFEIAYQMVLKERAEQAAQEFDKFSASDGDDVTSVSSRTSVHTV